MSDGNYRNHRGLVATLLIALLAGILYAVILLQGACNPRAAAWRTTAAVKAAGNVAAQALADEGDKQHRQCLSKHGPKTEGYANCIKDHYAAMLAWQNFVKPAINSALRATVDGLTIASKVKLKPDFDWKAALKPAACAILKIVSEWKHLFGKRAKTILGVLAGGEAFVCE